MTMERKKYAREYEKRVEEFRRLGFDPHSPLDSLDDEFPFVSKDIIRYSPQEFLSIISKSFKQEIEKRMIEKERKEKKKV